MGGILSQLLEQSDWHRWDPHIHAPGTALADKFAGDWDGYLDHIANADPPVTALGITDYCSVQCYEEFRRRVENRNDLQHVALVFPNIEFRLSVRGEKGRYVNIHLLVSPDDPNHIKEVNDALGRLRIEVRGQRYGCNREDLIKLGALLDSKKGTTEAAQYRKGVNQFKIDRSSFQDWRKTERWIRENTLIAISGGEDGVAGVRGPGGPDDGFYLLHDTLVGDADVVLSGSPSNREHLLGRRHGDPPAYIIERYGSLKPCLHGSDAHTLRRVLAPYDDRFCWVKAAPTFDGLRQVVHEPESRVHIGGTPPRPANPAHIVESISIKNHDGWFGTEEVCLSPYLTTIIGERGQGKTALVDLIAAATGAWREGTKSFLDSARPDMPNTVVRVKWADGTFGDPIRIGDLAQQESGDARVRYLSQQFVERLCSEDGSAAELTAEIEDVVFNHLPESERFGCESFADLRRHRTGGLSAERSEIREQLGTHNEQINSFFSTIATIEKKQLEVKRIDLELKKVSRQIKALIKPEDKTVAKAVEALRKLLVHRGQEAAKAKSQVHGIEEIQRRVERTRLYFEREFEDVKRLLQGSGIHPDSWNSFKPKFSGDVDIPVAGAMKKAKANVESIEGKAAIDGRPADSREVPKSIAAIRERLEQKSKSMKLDEQRAKRLESLQKSKSAAERKKASVQQTIQEIGEIKSERLPVARQKRMQRYLRYFSLLQAERAILETLYRPLADELEESDGEQSDLVFEVETHVDLGAWVAKGMGLIDQRPTHRYRAEDALLNDAEELLLEPWRTCDTGRIEQGVRRIAERLFGMGDENEPPVALLSHATKQHLADWVFDVDHITLRYDIKYKETSLRLLSPGTKGIVLLLLYLAIDSHDERPLIIDQPEENLDNSSVYKILVEQFRRTKKRRQTIVVTHNPNLVVNTDAERIVIAHADKRTNGLPHIWYDYGPIEDVPCEGQTAVREQICEILEGGEAAFRRREKRYRFVDQLPGRAN